jgi:N-acetylneuraminic acid mutarotase
MSIEIPKFDLMDNDNEIIILVNMAIFTFDGNKWNSILINDSKLPNSDVGNLLKPSLAEIYQPKEKKEKLLILTGGFNTNQKSSSKTTYVLNLKTDSQNCFLDLKFDDLNYSRFMHCSVNIQNKFILVIGGKTEKNFVTKNEILDINEKKWKNFPELLNPKANFSFCLINENNLFLYGGFEANGKYAENKLTNCLIDVNDFNKSIWKNINLKGDDLNLLPLACINLIPNDDNFYICGGSNGKEIIDLIFEINPTEETVEKIGKLNTPRSNYHMLMNNGNYFLIGGNVKEFKKNENNTELTNYIEKFSFDLNNDIIGSLISIKSDDIIKPLLDLNIIKSINMYKQEPGFPFSASLLSKK